jgi:hypothetical protein
VDRSAIVLHLKVRVVQRSALIFASVKCSTASSAPMFGAFDAAHSSRLTPARWPASRLTRRDQRTQQAFLQSQLTWQGCADGAGLEIAASSMRRMQSSTLRNKRHASC